MQTLAPSPSAVASIAASAFADLQHAWNAADGAAFGARFADESDFVNVRGEHHQGDRTFLGRAHQGIFDSVYAGSRVEYRVDSARALAPGVVVAVASSTLEAPTGPLRGTNHSVITAVLTEQDDRWAITAFHNTLVPPRG